MIVLMCEIGISALPNRIPQELTIAEFYAFKVMVGHNAPSMYYTTLKLEVTYSKRYLNPIKCVSADKSS
jgi:hypothetical protein